MFSNRYRTKPIGIAAPVRLFQTPNQSDANEARPAAASRPVLSNEPNFAGPKAEPQPPEALLPIFQ